MSETTKTSSEAERPVENPADTAAGRRSDDHRLHRLVVLGRRHPVLTTLALAGAGLFGGVELAVGALIGAGVATMIRRSNAPKIESEQPREPEVEPAPVQISTPSGPAKPHGLRDRVVAVIRAARGDVTFAHQSNPTHG